MLLSLNCVCLYAAVTFMQTGHNFAWDKLKLIRKHLEIQLITKRSESKLRHFEVIMTPLLRNEKKITLEMLVYSAKGVRIY